MTITNFTKMLGLTVEFVELYDDYSLGLVGVHRGLDRIPELHLTNDAFHNIAADLDYEISFRNGDHTVPCFQCMGIRVFCSLDYEQAAARGYLTEAEADFYGR